MNPRRTTLWGHPTGLTVLFLTGMWEVFALFGMRTILIFYLVKERGFASERAIAIYALSTAACVLMGFAGGLAADRWLGVRRAVVLGALLMAGGELLLLRPAALYAGLAAIAVGNGLFKPTLAAQVGLLYSRDDPRRDRAYVGYKVGCNLGALIAPIVCGLIGARFGWSRAFLACAAGMLISIAVYLGGSPWLGSGTAASEPGAKLSERVSASLPFSRWRLAVIWVAAILFWVVYRQIESTVALWADHNVDRSLRWGKESFVVPATWFQSLNPLLIFICAPIVSWFWAKRGKPVTVAEDAGKMAFGCALLAVAFGVLYVASARFTTAAGVPALWLAVAILPLTLAELYVDPIGQAMFSRLAARGLASLFLSLWFFTSFAAYLIGAGLGQLWTRISASVFFGTMAALAITAAVAMKGAGLGVCTDDSRHSGS